MEQKLLRLRNQEYKKIHRQWRRMHFKILMVTVMVVIMIEGLMFFVVRRMGLIHCTIGIYLIKYLFLPSIFHLCLVAISFFVLKSRRLSEQVKNYVISLAIVMVTFCISFVHGSLMATYGASMIAVMLTTIYGKKELTTVTAVACAVTQLISAYWSRWDSDKIYGELYSINIILFLIILGCAYALCMVTIQWEEKKQIIMLKKEIERQQLKKQVERDDLTGLYNRVGLREWFLNFQNERVANYYFVMIDIDHFKITNDTFGHSAGDGVLESLGKILLCQETDDFIPFRYGGDEFSILARNTTLKEVFAHCERIQQLYSASVFARMKGTQFSLSMGIAYNEGNLEPSKLIKHADSALYEMKFKSRGGIYIYKEEEKEL